MLTYQTGVRWIDATDHASRKWQSAFHRGPLPRLTAQHRLTPPLRCSNKVAVKYRNPCMWMAAYNRRGTRQSDAADMEPRSART